MKNLMKLVALLSAGLVAFTTFTACSDESETRDIELISETYSIYITFDANGGSIAQSSVSQEDSTSAVLHLPTSDKLGVSRAGYTFLGWATAADAEKPEYSEYSGYDEHRMIYNANGKFDNNNICRTTLYAVWKKGFPATKDTLASVIKSLTEDATVVLTENINGYSNDMRDYWTDIAEAFAEVSDVNVTLDFTLPRGYDIQFSSADSGDVIGNVTNLVGIMISDQCPAFENGSDSGKFLSCCKSLVSVEVVESEKYASVDGVVYSRDMTRLVFYPAGKTETSFTLPDTVLWIPAYAFNGNAFLTDVTLGSSLKVVGERAFKGCSALESVTFKNTEGWKRYSYIGWDSETQSCSTYREVSGEYSQLLSLTLTVTDASNNAKQLTKTNTVYLGGTSWYESDWMDYYLGRSITE